jgi:uncharacterized protein (TIRG00374 family)
VCGGTYPGRLGAFFHAVNVFFDHLTDVGWTALGLALACHLVKLLLRGRAWQNIVRAAYPASTVRYLSALGAYAAGVGVNSVVPARGGDVVKLYLLKQRVEGSTYATLAPTLIVETLFDFVVSSLILIWVLSIGVLPAHEVYSRIPTVDWKFFVDHEKFTGILVLALLIAAFVVFVVARRHYERFRARVAQGFAIMHRPRRLFVGVIVPQALSWVFRIACVFFFLRAFHVHATIHNALLAQSVESLATLFPATPGGAGTKQGLIVYLFRGEAISKSLLLAFSVGMNIALVITNLVCGLVAIGMMARTLSFKRIRVAEAADRDEATKPV